MSKKSLLSGIVFFLIVCCVQKAIAQNSCPGAYPDFTGMNHDFGADPCNAVCQFAAGPNEIRCLGDVNRDTFYAVSNPGTQNVFIWGWIETGAGTFMNFCCQTGDPGIPQVRRLYIDAREGDDVIFLTDPLSPFTYHHNSRLFGRDGKDIIHGADAPGFFDVIEAGDGGTSLDPQRAYGYAGDDQMFGGDGVDNFLGDTGDDTMDGGDGDDTLYGDFGADTIYGGGGDDWIYGEGGVDDLYGDEGDDYILGGDMGDTIDGGEGNDYILGGDGDDVIFGGPWTVNPDDDCIFGEEGDDWMDGRAGNDGLHGGDGNDTLMGNTDDDYMCGAGDTDYIYPNTGTDYCSELKQDYVTGNCNGISLAQCETGLVSVLGCTLP